jgi:TatD DNase family protein
MIDSHCHIAGTEFRADLHDVVARARAAGVSAALVILSAGDAADDEGARNVRESWPAARFSVGIHPHQAGASCDDLDRRLAMLDADLGRHRAVAIGEIGLDYHYDFSPRAVQQEVFRRQLALARQRELPVIIHTREATEDTFRILREAGNAIPTVFHCFSGGTEMANTALEMGAWLSFAGIVTFPKALELREVARAVPAGRFLVETDSPYLTPVPHRGRRNEPAFVTRVVEAIAELRGEDRQRIAEQTTASFARLFGSEPNGLGRRAADAPA